MDVLIIFLNVISQRIKQISFSFKSLSTSAACTVTSYCEESSTQNEIVATIDFKLLVFKVKET